MFFVLALATVVSAGSNHIACSDRLCIEETTVYGLTQNEVYITITDTNSKPDNLNITMQFLNHAKTRQLSYENTYIFDSYLSPVYGQINTTLGKCKTITPIPNGTGNICGMADGTFPDCNYIAPDKSCWAWVYKQTGNEIKYDYFPITDIVKDKTIASQKVSWDFLGSKIPLPKDGVVKLKFVMDHPPFFGDYYVPDDVNEYSILVCGKEKCTASASCAAYGTQFCTLLDPYWYAGNTLYRRELYNLSTTLILPVNGTSTTYLNDGAAMVYARNCSVGSEYLYYNSSTVIAGAYDSTPTKCAWFSTYPTQIDTPIAVANLKGYYSFDEANGTIAYDSTGNNDGTNDGADVNTAGKIWKAYDFERTESDWINLSTEKWQYTTFSVSAWIKQESTSAAYYDLVSECSGATCRYGWVLSVYNTRIAFETSSATNRGVDQVLSTIGTISTGNWYHIVAVRNGTTSMKVYINGVQNGSDLSLSALTYASTEINGISRGGTSTEYFDGIIDDVQIWNKALSQTEITTLYNLGTSVGAEAAPVCGNSILEGDEQCDDGNTNNGDCCSSTCQYESAATVCRAMGGICDKPELCDGAGTCPADTYNSTDVCRASAGICDIAETCPGTGVNCPTDAFNNSADVCRPSEGVCDIAEYCDGINTTCPFDINNVTLTNTSWSSWYNITNCLSNNTYEQERYQIQYDSNFCGIVNDTFFYEHNWQPCVYSGQISPISNVITGAALSMAGFPIGLVLGMGATLLLILPLLLMKLFDL